MKKNSSNSREPQAAARQKPKRKPQGSKPEMLSRNVEITSFSATVRLNAVHKGDEPYVEGQPWLELCGTAKEPVNGVADVKISMWPREKVELGTARPASVGVVLGARPQLAFGLTWSQAEFDRVWNLAISGHLKFAHLYFTKPHYNSGLVVSASFSNELEE